MCGWGSIVEQSFECGSLSWSKGGATFTRPSLWTRKRKLPEPHPGNAGPVGLSRVRDLNGIPAPHGLGSPQSLRAVHDFRLLPATSPPPGSTEPNRDRVRCRSNPVSLRGPGLIEESSAVSEDPGTSNRMEQARYRVLPPHLREVHTTACQRQRDRGGVCRGLWFHNIHHRPQEHGAPAKVRQHPTPPHCERWDRRGRSGHAPSDRSSGKAFVPPR
jgi:hypothetical protein